MLLTSHNWGMPADRVIMAALIYTQERTFMTHPIEKASGDASVPGANIAENTERTRSMHRTASSRAVAKASPAATSKTPKGKDGAGRPQRATASEVSAWKKANKATIAETAKHFDLPPTIAKRWCAVA